MTLVAFLAIASHTSVYAQEKGSKDELTGCIFAVEKKRIKFAAYQPQINNKSLCRKLPETTGTTYFSLDLADKPLRKRALEIKVVPIKKSDDKFQTITPIVNFEVTSSPTGVVSFEYDFQGAEGRYRLEVVNKQDNTKGSFEFEVGAKEFKWEGKFGQRVAFGFFGFLVILSLLYLARRKNKT